MGIGLAALSFISGAAGLLYEVLWAKRLGVLLGSTAAAQTTALAAFLGGLCAGSAVLGRRADRAACALRFYARLELGVAALGAAAPALLDAPGRRWLSAPLAAAPAFLMGGALPALVLAAGGDRRRSVGALYGVNSAGAVLGCLAASFWLIPRLGLAASFVATAGLNALAAAGAFRLSKRPAPPAVKPKQRSGAEAALPWSFLATAMFLSGYVSVSYEQAWTRLLALVMGSSVYSFSEMLAGFIAGISLGGWLASRAGRRDPAVLLGLAELGAAAAALASLPFCDRLPFGFLRLRGLFGDGVASYRLFEAAKFALCSAFMLGPTVCLGATLPLAVAAAGEEKGGAGALVGGVFAANAAGNVAGACAALWLMPRLGLEGLMRSGATIHVCVGAAVLWLALDWSPARKRALALACAAAVPLYSVLVPRWDARMLCLGAFRGKVTGSLGGFQAFKERFGRFSVLFHRDGPEATVTVTRYPEGHLTLKVNAKTDASTGEDMRTQILLGHVPALLRPGARRALVVGWGSGVTAGALLAHPLEDVEAVELLPEVVDASRWFEAENRGAACDPRLELRLADAKTDLRSSRCCYDLIVSEPSNPWMAGVGSLFTSQFYARARAKLAPGGVMAQWFHVYEMDDELFALVLRTFRSAFAHVAVIDVIDSDLILLGSAEPLAPDWRAVEREYARDAVWRDLARAGIHSLPTLLALNSAGDASTAAMAGSGPLNDDDRPRLEYGAPLALFRNDVVSLLRGRDDREDPAFARDLLLGRYLAARGRPLDPHEMMDRVVFPHSVREKKILTALVADWKRRYPRDPKADEARAWLDRQP